MQNLAVGIDKMNFYAPGYFVDMANLAHARDVDPKKFKEGIGQDQMAVPPISQDIVTMGANAAVFLTEADKAAIDMVLVGTESGIDQSKSSAVYIHHLLGIQPFARSVEFKEACYSATAALHLGLDYVRSHPERKVLVVASDIARYGLETSGEATQGAGAVAMLLSANPSLALVDPVSAFMTEDVMDFWRPNYTDKAMVDGKLSLRQYTHVLEQVWEKYQEETGLTLDDFEAICFHLPYTKMGLKGLRRLMRGASDAKKDSLRTYFEASEVYSRRIGNVYTGSLYLSLISLLDQADSLKAGDRIGMYSYGSGSVGEFFSLTLAEGFQAGQHKAAHEAFLDQREEVSVERYEELFNDRLPSDGSQLNLTPAHPSETYYVQGMAAHQRRYGKK
ncbi:MULTISPECIES: hydroxymethylglutaryl-CoA synthase [Aerococcus]|uniref:Hydroxymethylglutaryl-CoA synthase n=1 Tax=Aerococcus sanguinicola TaxID=119206 RepID=A0A5N1GJA8_9LACT|nr:MULTISPECIES: hydroxymethylglutaryl-CoA synthase [Aerococcus]KAA9300474.1 hydroxymethylglutaryl-CoA synthase [Aerococcus sanguinicola]MDK6369713.1 hydroxymethylglutaryl-CoA synthase [Aerococcus sp. UMB9870]MDK6940044.1 hydroxymethylglutaryl-CoA synthase [Aerococcus sp. UMB8487]OFK21941.1 hydroxymethylglutaryl-CoA synthase [Aerococcus sp. HMSC072A12]OFR33934.1 hydroxymethylglutaryl-CoA synthase [Aerococcus sp. HMSC061A03]